MKALSNTVGENGANTKHDSALVQAILFACRRPVEFDRLRSRYLTAIDGDFGRNSRAALKLFQNDHVFADSTRRVSFVNPNATPGLVRAGDATWQAFERLIDPAFRELCYVTGSKIPFIAGTQQQYSSRRAKAYSEVFNEAFRTRLVTLIDTLFNTHRIAIDICPQGSRRTFQQQYNLLVGPGNVTNAGPGESNHNFGQAVDLGFDKLRWVRRDGSIEESETHWLHRMNVSPDGPAQALIYWNVMRSVGETAAVGLHRGPVADRPHLQAWSDATVSMRRSLAGILTSAGGMRWGAVPGGYACNLGNGNIMHPVGSAAQIWSKTGPVTPQLVQAAGLPVVPAQLQASIQTLRDRLRADFDAADSNWRSWQPL